MCFAIHWLAANKRLKCRTGATRRQVLKLCMQNLRGGHAKRVRPGNLHTAEMAAENFTCSASIPHFRSITPSCITSEYMVVMNSERWEKHCDSLAFILSDIGGCGKSANDALAVYSTRILPAYLSCCQIPLWALCQISVTSQLLLYVLGGTQSRSFCVLLLSVETTVVARHLKSRSQGLKAQKNMPSRVKIPEVVFQGNVMMGDALEQHQWRMFCMPRFCPIGKKKLRSTSPTPPRKSGVRVCCS